MSNSCTLRENNKTITSVQPDEADDMVAHVDAPNTCILNVQMQDPNLDYLSCHIPGSERVRGRFPALITACDEGLVAKGRGHGLELTCY
jgi:hypothetical protein